MSFHTGQTFVYGETPSATKWQYVWDNDYALADGTTETITDLQTSAYGTGSVTPEKRSGGFYTGVIAGATLGTTGNKQITGVGFKPKLVRFTQLLNSSTVVSSTGSGCMTEDYQWSTATDTRTAGTTTFYTYSTTDYCLSVASTGSVVTQAEYVSMDDDGFTINVTTAGTSRDFAYEAYA